MKTASIIINIVLASCSLTSSCTKPAYRPELPSVYSTNSFHSRYDFTFVDGNKRYVGAMIFTLSDGRYNKYPTPERPHVDFYEIATVDGTTSFLSAPNSENNALEMPNITLVRRKCKTGADTVKLYETNRQFVCGTPNMDEIRIQAHSFEEKIKSEFSRLKNK